MFGQETRVGAGMLAGLLLVSIGVGNVSAQQASVDQPETLPAPDPSDPLAPWITALQLETLLLTDDLSRYARDRLRRDQLGDRIEQLYGAIDNGLESEAAESVAMTRRLIEQLERGLGERSAAAISERHLMESILERRVRVMVLQSQIDQLSAREAPVAGPLTGSWNVVMLPLEQRGRFELEQTGALVGGTYRLAGGWSGSLQGTLVNNKVFLIRIDSRLGKSMEYEGYLSGDGKTIRGEWQSYELAEGVAASGQWSASKE